MPKALSEDIRERIIYFYEEGISIKDTAERLHISCSSVDRIRRKYKATGSFKEKERSHSGRPRQLVPDLNILREFVKNNPELSGKDMAEYFKCSASLICIRLGEARITYKKNLYLQRTKRQKKTIIQAETSENSAS
jgi:transposase